MLTNKLSFVLSMCLLSTSTWALPVLRESAGDFGTGGIVTIYPDHRKADLFYFMPNQVDFAVDRTTGMPTFGLNTYGAEQSDLSKIFGYMTFTFRPGVSPDVDKQLKIFMADHPGIRLAPLPVAESYLTVGTSREGTPSEGAKDYFKNWDLPPFGGLLETEVGGNAFLTGLGAKVLTKAIKNPSMVQINSCYTVDGVTPAMDATVKVDYQKVFTHWKAKVRVGWSFLGANISKEVIKLQESGAIDIRIHGDTKFEEVVMEMARQMARDYLTPQLPNGTAEADLGKIPFKHINFGWGSLRIEERRTITLNIQKQANIVDVRCIAVPFRGLAPYADKIIQNTPITADVSGGRI